LEVGFSFRNYFPIVCFSKVEEKELLISLPVFVKELMHNDGFEVSDLLSWIIVHETSKVWRQLVAAMGSRRLTKLWVS